MLFFIKRNPLIKLGACIRNYTSMYTAHRFGEDKPNDAATIPFRFIAHLVIAHFAWSHDQAEVNRLFGVSLASIFVFFIFIIEQSNRYWCSAVRVYTYICYTYILFNETSNDRAVKQEATSINGKQKQIESYKMLDAAWTAKRSPRNDMMPCNMYNNAKTTLAPLGIYIRVYMWYLLEIYDRVIVVRAYANIALCNVRTIKSVAAKSKRHHSTAL